MRAGANERTCVGSHSQRRGGAEDVWGGLCGSSAFGQSLAQAPHSSTLPAKRMRLEPCSV